MADYERRKKVFRSRVDHIIDLSVQLLELMMARGNERTAATVFTKGRISEVMKHLPVQRLRVITAICANSEKNCVVCATAQLFVNLWRGLSCDRVTHTAICIIGPCWKSDDDNVCFCCICVYLWRGMQEYIKYRYVDRVKEWFDACQQSQGINHALFLQVIRFFELACRPCGRHNDEIASYIGSKLFAPPFDRMVQRPIVCLCYWLPALLLCVCAYVTVLLQVFGAISIGCCE